MQYKPLTASIFKSPITIHSDSVSYRAGDVAMIVHPEKLELNKRNLTLNPHLLKVKPVDEIFKRFNFSSVKNEAFVQMSDGIGDYFFFSAVAQFLYDHDVHVTMFVDRKTWPVMSWFETPISLKHFSDPIIHNYAPFSPKPERIAIEYVGVQGRERLWISCLFDAIGVSDPDPEYLRPRLRTDRISDIPTMLPPDAVLICHRASSPSRSSRFEDFYKPWVELNPFDPIYVHINDCTDEDKAFIATCDNVTIIPKVTIERYLLNVYDAAFVISTDSSALHFREGVEKPALGVYASMEAKSRTLHYQHTRTVDIRSSCPHQPCYFHQQKPSDRCQPMQWTKDKYAPCQSGTKFQEQLKEALCNYR